MLTAICVNVGTKYDDRYVRVLQDAVAEHLAPDRFVCVSDHDIEGVEVSPAYDGLPGWWQKVTLFNRVTRGRLLYLDLDVVVQADLRPLIRDGNWIMADPWRPMLNSSVMLFDPATLRHVWAGFHESVMSSLPGDQEWITIASHKLWNRYSTADVDSYKDASMKGRAHDAPIIVFHGDPKPHQVADPFVVRNWHSRGTSHG